MAVLLLSLAIGETLFGSDPVVSSMPSGRTHGDVDAEHTVVRLSTNGPTVAEMVAAVHRQARQTPGSDRDVEVTVVLTGDLAKDLQDERPLLAGQQLGATAYIHVDVDAAAGAPRSGSVSLRRLLSREARA